jgi:hypothetical protein
MTDMRDTPTRPTVHVRMHEAYDLNVTVEILPAREIPGLSVAGCQPRQGVERVEKDPLELPEETRDWLLAANDLVIGWLARDEGNRRTFLADPLGALSEAGVEMDRAHIKALARTRESIGLAEAISPGLQLRSARATAKKTGRVKRLDPRGSTWVAPKFPGESDDGDDDRHDRDDKGKD